MNMTKDEIYGINKRLYNWTCHTTLFKHLMDDGEQIKRLLGNDPVKRELASREFATKIWSQFPELGPTPFFELLSSEEYNRSFYDNYRDHTTHQVKVFLLGLFLYEECDTICQAIDKYLAKEFPTLIADEYHKAFLAIWTTTALYHDIGYLVECDEADDKKNSYWETIKKEINKVLKNPLSHTINLGISARMENEYIDSKSDEIDSFQNIETDSLFEFLQEAAEKSYLDDDDKNALQAYYNYAQKENPSIGRSKYRDHGIASALLLRKIWQSYKKHLEEISNSEPKNVKKRKSIEKTKAIYEKIETYEKEITISVGAIALHNINKELWINTNMKHVSLEEFSIEIEGDNALPFAFLLKLTDELQDWDRQYYRQPSQEDKLLEGKDMDLEIKDGKIYVSYLSDNRELRHPETYPGGRYNRLKKKLLLYTNNIFLENLLEYNATTETNWGLKNIYFSRSEAHVDYKKEGFAKNSCDIIAFGLKNFRQNVTKLVEKSAKKGLKIRILTLQPDSLYVKQREIEENMVGGIKNSIIELLRWAEKLKASLPEDMKKEDVIQIKLYDSLPLDFYCKMDNKLYIGPYLAGKESRDLITYEFEKGEVWNFYSSYFESLWNNEVNGINPLDKAHIYHVRTQEEIVNRILEGFCGILTGFNDTESKIRAVVVKYLPQQGNRKTIFFWNKEEGSQRYPEVNRNYGVAGRLEEYRCPYIHHFLKGQEGIYYYFSTSGELQEPVKIKDVGGKKKGLKAILVAPIWDKKEENILGLVTFEFFAKEPINFNLLNDEVDKYRKEESSLDEKIDLEKKEFEDNKDWKWPELRKLSQMFSIAKECASILAQIVINYMEVDDDKVFATEEYTI